MEQAWERYREGLEEVRRIIYTHRFAESPRELNEAHYHVQQIQAAAFNVAIAPRPDYPRFLFNLLFDPVHYTWLGPNPDTPYKGVILDGARTYRIWGKRSSTTPFLFMQSSNSYLTLPLEKMKLNGAYDLATFKIEADGSFEIIVSAEPHDGNWIKLDPEQERNFILVREYCPDWNNGVLSELHVEPIDQKEARPIVLSEEDMIRRIDDAVRFMTFATEVYTWKVTEDTVRDAGGYNRFVEQSWPSKYQGNPLVTFNMLIFDIQPDEALIVELAPPPDCRFWNIQLADVWGQTIDYTHHQGTLNISQAAADADGKVRAVLSHRDPGIQNWITPVESRKGQFIVRWVPRGDSTPTARKVRFDEVRDHLPKDTRLVNPEQREKLLQDRRRGILRIYGY
jgi:hypothetical protein